MKTLALIITLNLMAAAADLRISHRNSLHAAIKGSDSCSTEQCRTAVNRCKANSGKDCVYPFKFLGTTYYPCATCQAEWRSLSAATVTATSNYSTGYSADKLGVPGYWCSATGTNANVEIKIEFATPVRADGFRVKSHSGYRRMSFKNYEFFSAAEEKPLRKGTRPDTDCQDDDCEWNLFPFPKTTSKVFKLKIIDNWGYPRYTCLEEIELHVPV